MDLSNLDLTGLSEEQITELVDDLPDNVVHSLLGQVGIDASSAPPTPAEQAVELDDTYRSRPHLDYLSDRLAAAVAAVKQGENRRMIISMPPRSGKSLLTSQVFPTWVLRQNPSWPMALISHEANLATSWGRQIRRWVEQGRVPGIEIAPDAGAASEWETAAGGSILSRSLGGSFTGRGAKVLLIDDPIKDFVSAHSRLQRDAVWNWWLTVAQTRLQPPYLIIVIATRWHEDDLIGRLTSHEYEGDPAEWERIVFPAIAEHDDVLGRSPGQPLYSPLLDETEGEALTRWEEVKRSVGSYAFNAMYQQHPSPAEGEVFNTNWWRFWTSDKSRADADDTGRLVYFDPEDGRGTWLDSWDCAFKGTDSSDFVVGQRWCKLNADRFLVDQTRGRSTFTETLDLMLRWSKPDTARGGRHVHTRLVEDKANGTAVIDVLKSQVSGMIPVNPTDSKEARARSVTPECESGNVILPDPSDPGNEWVADLLSELQEFPHGAHDDQVDSLSQALTRLRPAGKGAVGIPGRSARRVDQRANLLHGQRRINRAQGR